MATFAGKEMPEGKHVSADELRGRLKAMQEARAGHAADKPYKHVQLRQVQVFIEVIQAGSVGKAATELGVSVSAVSQAIADLEENLGTSLFEHRGNRNVELTSTGKVLAEKGNELLSVETDIRSAIAGETVAPRYVGQPRTFAAKAPSPRRDLRREQNAGEVLAAVAFIESKLPANSEVQFPKALVDELERALPDLGTSRESVDRMASLLDLMQVSVTPESDRVALLDSTNRVSTAFQERYEGSERVRSRQSRDPSQPRRR